MQDTLSEGTTPQPPPDLPEASRKLWVLENHGGRVWAWFSSSPDDCHCTPDGWDFAPTQDSATFRPGIASMATTTSDPDDTLILLSVFG